MYTIAGEGVMRADGAFLVASDNPDWSAYQAWLAAGNTPTPAATPAATPPVAVPQSVDMWQARAALRAAGKLDAANAVIAAAGNPTLSDAWEYGNTITRGSPAIASLGAALGLTDADIDGLFVAASNIRV